MCRPTDALTHSLTTQGRANKARRFLSQTGEYFTGAMDEMIACYVKGVSRSNRLKQNHTARSLQCHFHKNSRRLADRRLAVIW